MNFATRTILAFTLLLAFAGQLTAQSAPAKSSTASETTATAATAAVAPSSTDSSMTSQEVRGQFTSLLHESPNELPMILKLDPTLLSNDAYLSGYPELQRFVVAHPEVRRNPGFYLSAFRLPGERDGALHEIIEPVTICAVMAIIGFTLVWFVRTVIEQRRWTRLSRIQTEVHNKILDRFASSNELLEYIKTPAGTKFLESAPIPLHAEQPREMGSPSLLRALWSLQIGIIVAAGGLGTLLVSLRFEKEAAEGFFALGAIAFSVGVGFIASAAVSLFLARRVSLPATVEEA
ncbi:MAG: hypothetical protein JOZ54_13330 [Acidobacteria bacterium]|nr:hypothetical protein [Acidobacteriota bacterium]